MTIPLSFTVAPTAPDVVTAVSVATLTRSDTGLAPAGVTLPIVLSLVLGMWQGLFDDASPSPYYVATLQFTYSDGTGQYTQPVNLPVRSGPSSVNGMSFEVHISN